MSHGFVRRYCSYTKETLAADWDHVFNSFSVRQLDSAAAGDDNKADYPWSKENVRVDSQIDSICRGNERAIVNLRVFISRCVPASSYGCIQK